MVDEGQRVYITIHYPVVDGQNCSSNYRWHSIGEPRVRIVQKVNESSGGEADFESLQPKEILYAASVNLKLEYRFYLLGKRFRALVTRQKIGRHRSVFKSCQCGYMQRTIRRHYTF